MKITDGIKQKRFIPQLTDENKVLLLLVFFALFFRLLTITNIETGGDAASVWFSAKRLIYGLPYPISHHSARFGMIIPVYLSQLIFGTHPVVYYMVPLTFFLLQVIFLYKIAVRAYGINLAFLSSILLIFLPKMFSHAVQIKPDTFCAAYILIAVYLLFKFQDSEKKTPVYSYLLFSALSMFLAYMSKETSLFFLPGIAICIWIMKRKFRYVFVYGSLLFLLFLAETAIYHFTTEFQLGRISIVTTSHLESGNLLALPSVWTLFLRYAQLNSFEKIYFFAYILGTCYLVIQAKKIKMDEKVRSLIIIPLVFFILLTFAVKSINPVAPAMSFNPRHLVPAAPFMSFIISYAVIVLFSSIRGAGKSPERVQGTQLRLFTGIIAGLSVLSLAAVLLLLPHFPQGKRDSFFGDHPFMATFRYHTILNNAYANGIPIIQEKVVAERWQKPVDAVRKYLKAGYPLGEACIKAKVPEEDYRYSLGRVREGDYKTFKIFTHIFWDGDSSSEDKFTIPEMEKTDIKERTIGFMVNGKVREEADYKSKLFGNEDNLVVVMTEKPIRVKQMKLKEFLEKK